MELVPVPRDPDEPFVPDLSEGAEAGLYLSLFELMNEGLIITSDETILEVNSAVCRLMERSYRDLAGQPLSTLFPSERAFLNARAALFIQGEMRGSLRVRLPGGRERDLAYVAAARIRPGLHAIILGPDPVMGLGPEPARPTDTVWPRLAAAIDQPALVIDGRDHIRAANAPARRRFGNIDETLTGKALSQICQLSDPERDSGPVTVSPCDGSPDLHGRIIAGPEPGWRVLLLTGEAPMAPVDTRSGKVFRHAPMPMLVVRAADGQVLAANDAAAASLGHTRQTLMQMQLGGLCHRPDEGELANGTWTWLGTAGHYDAPTRVQPLDGHRAEWLVIHDSPGADTLDTPAVRFWPILDTSDGRTIAAEAVWNEGGDDTLAQFLARLTDTFEAMRDWPSAQLPVVVPIGAAVIMTDGFVQQLCDRLTECAVPADTLELSVDESGLAALPDPAMDRLLALAGQGVRLAVHNIGMDALPVQRLMALPVRTLRLAPVLARDAVVPKRAGLVRAAIATATALELAVEATGVEDMAQAEALATLGCLRQQGPIYGAPVAARDLARSD